MAQNWQLASQIPFRPGGATVRRTIAAGSQTNKETMDRLIAMQVFVEVARRGSFTAASRELDLSAPW
jgi:hypothetical protein